MKSTQMLLSSKQRTSVCLPNTAQAGPRLPTGCQGPLVALSLQWWTIPNTFCMPFTHCSKLLTISSADNNTPSWCWPSMEP